MKQFISFILGVVLGFGISAAFVDALIEKRLRETRVAVSDPGIITKRVHVVPGGEQGELETISVSVGSNKVVNVSVPNVLKSDVVDIVTHFIMGATAPEHRERLREILSQSTEISFTITSQRP